jgi:hypothetical protein
MIDISRRNSKKDSKRVTTKRKPRSLPVQMMSKLNRERCVSINNEILQNSFYLTCMGPDTFRIIKYSSLSDATYTDIASYRYFFLLPVYLAFAKKEEYLILVVSINSWFWVSEIVFCVFWGLHI